MHKCKYLGYTKKFEVHYSKEYFELCKKRLNPGGVVTQWVPLYESRMDVVKSEVATFLLAFPNGTIWGNQDEGYGYDVVLLGKERAMTIDVDALQQRLDREDLAGVQASLDEVYLECRWVGVIDMDAGGWSAGRAGE